MIGVCYMVGFVGGFLGKLLGSACLRLGIDDLATITESGTLGAWWLGWPLIAIVHSLLAICFLFLPHHLPATEVSSPEEAEAMADNHQKVEVILLSHSC